MYIYILLTYLYIYQYIYKYTHTSTTGKAVVATDRTLAVGAPFADYDNSGHLFLKSLIFFCSYVSLAGLYRG
jgi:hypothetical protein